MVKKNKNSCSNFMDRCKRGSFWSVFFLILLIFFAGFYVGNSLLSGRVVLGLDDLFGGNNDLVISMSQGELLPGNSSILVYGRTENYSFLLSELVELNSEGNYYVDGFSINETGQGFGDIGKIVKYPKISFTLLVQSILDIVDGGSLDSGDSEDEVDANESTETPSEPVEAQGNNTEEETPSEPAEEEQEETPSEPAEEEQAEDTIDTPITGDSVTETEEQEETPSEPAEEEQEETPSEPAVESAPTESSSEPAESLITGEVVLNEYEEVEGDVDYNTDFTYFVGNKSVAFKPGSILVEGEAEVDYLSLDLDIVEGEVIVSTDYMLETEGFGEEFLGDNFELRIDLEEFGVNLSDVLSISLEFEGDNFADVEYGVAGATEDPIAPVEVVNKSLVLNDISVTQYGAVVGKPVKWVKVVNVSDENVLVEVPEFAENISVLVDEEINEEIEVLESEELVVELEYKDEEEISVMFTGQVSLNIENNKGLVNVFFESFLSIFKFTGNVVIEQDESDNSILVNVSEEIDSSTEEVAVAYYTPAPVSNETIIIEGEKRVIVSAPDEYNYTDVFVYASIYEVPGMEKVPMGSNSLQIKWYPRESVDLSLANTVSEDVEDLLVVESVEAISEEVRIVPQNELEFFDVDNDGFIDFVGWVVPHLSAQTYEIILITEASELNFNRELLRDIYGYVNALDGNYTAIAPGNFVRVTFEQELDNTKDITLYANSNGGSVEVYEKDANELLMTFENLNNFEENKLFLTNLVGVQDVFDLKVVGASVEFDYIVDPVTGCDPAGASCVDSTCDAIYLDSIPGWTWYDNWGCVDDSTGITVVNPDSLCDTFFLDGKDGDCAYYDNGDSNAHMCPSYERLSESRSVVADDCICPNGICDYNSVYNFDHEFFAGPQSINCSSPNPSINGSCSGESITYAEDASINVTANYVNSQITAQKITISSTGYVVYDNVTLYVEEFVVESGAYVEFRNGGNTVWHNGDWNISGTVVSNSETHRINVTSDDEFGINVLAGGNLTILNGTNITNGEDATSEYYFNVYGDLSLEDSYISEMTTSGVYLQTGAVVNALGNITFSNNLGSSITTKEDVSLSGDLITDETCFTIAEDDVVLDGSGFGITGDGLSVDWGIYAINIVNLAIENITLTNFGVSGIGNGGGIYLSNVNSSNLSMVNSSSNVIYGLRAQNIFYNNILNSSFLDQPGGISFTDCNDNSFENLVIGGNDEGLSLAQNSRYNTLTNITLTNNSIFGIRLSGSNYNFINSSIFTDNGVGLGFDVIGPPDTSYNNTILNNNFVGIGTKIDDVKSGTNYLIYNNSYGQIEWIKSDLDTSNSLTFPGNITIGNNSAEYVSNGAGDNLNSTANVTLYSPDLSGITSPVILKDGEACGSDCYNFTPLDSATVVFNVTSWSNYSIGEGAEAQTYFTFQINTSKVSGTNFSFQADNYNDLDVLWGDGGLNIGLSGNGLISHTYVSDGVYNVSVNGYANRISYYEGEGDMLIDILTNISNGISGIDNSDDMFRNTSNFGLIPLTEPAFFDNVSRDVTNMNGMFQDSQFNQDISNWNTSSVTTMVEMFQSSQFNGDISNWDTSSLALTLVMFRYSQFNGNISNWNTSSVSSMWGMFDSSQFDGDISNWDVSSVISMGDMFQNSPFNQDIGSWNVSAVTIFGGMFNGAQLSTVNYDSLLTGWASLSPALSDSEAFDAGSSQYCLGASARNDTLIGFHGWDVVDGGKNASCFNPNYYFTFQINTSKGAGTTFSFKADNCNNFDVIWGDGNSSTNLSGSGWIDHTYDSEGVYNISVSGYANRILYYQGEEEMLVDILSNMSNGLTGINSSDSMFRGTSNFGLTPLSEPAFFDDVSGNVTNMQIMFYSSQFNGDISNWNTSSATTFRFLFGTSQFNGDISNWDTSSVTNMEATFEYSPFNGNISNWNTSSVTTMLTTFAHSQFNGDISNWDTSSVTNMEATFRNSPFDQDIGSWNVSAVTNFVNLLYDSQLSTANYDSLLTGWASLSPALSDSENVRFGSSEYCEGGSARNDTLIGVHSWIITDGGQNASCDAFGPNVTIIYPVQALYQDINVSQLNYTATDDSGLDSCWYNNGTANSSTISAGINFSDLSGTDGSNTWTLYCNDTLGKVGNASVQFNSTYLTQCGILDIAGGEYGLHNDVSTTGTCFITGIDDVILGGNGYEIGGVSLSGGIYSFGNNNITVFDFSISNPSGGGVSFRNVSGSVVTNISTNAGDYGVKIYEGSSNNTISNIFVSNATYQGVVIQGSNNNRLINITVENSGSDGVYLWGSSNNMTNVVTRYNYGSGITIYGGDQNLLRDIESYSNIHSGNGIKLSYADGNRIINLDSWNNSGKELDEGHFSSSGNILIYNNSYGQIEWTSDSFKDNMDVVGDLILGDTIQITEDYVFIDSSLAGDGVDSSMNITSYSTGISANPKIKSASSTCSDCYMVASVSDMHTFNVTGVGNYSLDYQNRIPLYSGWNMISFGTDDVAGATEDANITLEEGWNLIGYSGVDNVSHASVEVDGDAFGAFGVSGDFALASNIGVSSDIGNKVQKQFVTLDAVESKYRLAPYHESDLQRNKAYWVYANESSNLTVPGSKKVGAGEESISLSELKFSNGSVEINLTGAISEGWVNGTDEDHVIKWYNSSTNDTNKWVDVSEWECGEFGVCTGINISSWDGYFIKGMTSGIEILR